MKKQLIMLIALLGIALTTQAQSIGILVQPNFDKEYVSKGFYIESTLFQDLGIYADYNLHISRDISSPRVINRSQKDQINVGLSYKINETIKIIGSSTVLNSNKYTYKMYNEEGYIEDQLVNKNSYNNLYGISGIFGIGGTIQALVGYKTNSKFNNNNITIGIGFKLD